MSFIGTITGSHENVSVAKALRPLTENRFFYEDVLPGMLEERPLRPRILSTLLTGATQEDFFKTSTFTYMQEIRHNALPTGKRYDAVGDEVKADKEYNEFLWKIPSFGIAGSVIPSEWQDRYVPGDTLQMKEAYLLSRLVEKIDNSWLDLKERQLMNLITTDTPDFAGGPFNTWDFHEEIIGSTRTEVALDLTNANTVAVYNGIIDQMEAIRQKCMIRGEAMPSFVLLAGKDTFDAMADIEARESFPREIRNILDLAQQAMPAASFDGTLFQIRNFTPSKLDILTIRMTQEAGGIKLADDALILLPVQSGNFLRVGYTGARTRRTDAMSDTVQKMYTYSGVDDFGVRFAQESNYLTAMTGPDLMVRFDVTLPA